MLTQADAPVLAATTEEFLQRLIVPVDASTASIHALDLAIRLAQQRRSELMLVALLPDPKPDDEIDPDMLNALWMQSELGMGMPMAVREPDEATRIQSRYETVLLPLQRRAAAAGIDATLRLLRGDGLESQFRRLLRESGDSAVVVLSSPRRLFGPLHALTSALWPDPQCATYVAGVDSAPPQQVAQERARLRRIVAGRQPKRIAHAAPSHGAAAR